MSLLSIIASAARWTFGHQIRQSNSSRQTCFGSKAGTSHCSVLLFYFQRRLIADDLVAERLASDLARKKHVSDLEGRVERLEEELASLKSAAKGAAGT